MCHILKHSYLWKIENHILEKKTPQNKTFIPVPFYVTCIQLAFITKIAHASQKKLMFINVSCAFQLERNLYNHYLSISKLLNS